MTTPIVDFRYGDKYFVTEFVQPDNYEVKRIIDSIEHTSNDCFVLGVANYIRDKIKYPFDRSGEPATEGEQRRYKRGCGWIRKDARYYVWGFPAMVAVSGYGYCAESANLCTSLLRAKDILSWTAIGEVRKTSTDELLGYHAWTVVDYRGEEYIDETTLDPPAKPLVPRKDAYDRLSDWAEDGNVYYIEHGRYDEDNYTGLTDIGSSGLIFQLLGKSWGIVQACGLEAVKTIPPKTLYKEWRKEEALKHKQLVRAFGGVRWS